MLHVAQSFIILNEQHLNFANQYKIETHSLLQSQQQQKNIFFIFNMKEI